MKEAADAFLTPWANFYLITGSSAAALTGLVFVVITLVANSARPRTPDGISVYSTPTVVHFGVALFLSAGMSAPWRSLVPVALLVGVAAAFGLGYGAYTTLRSRRFAEYRPQLDDWLRYSVLPLLAYLALLAVALGVGPAPVPALFLLGGAVLLLLFIGIHNAWDVVTFLALVAPESSDSNRDDEPGRV